MVGRPLQGGATAQDLGSSRELPPDPVTNGGLPMGHLRRVVGPAAERCCCSPFFGDRLAPDLAGLWRSLLGFLAPCQDRRHAGWGGGDWSY